MDKREKQIFLFGILIIVISVFTADLISKEFFAITYLVGVGFTLLSLFFGKNHMDKNTFGKIISRVGLAMIMTGIFYPMGMMKQSISLNLQIGGSGMMLIGLFFKK